jgi:hypothetical protein
MGEPTLIPRGKENKMHTLFDFITHIKGVEYLIALSFIAGFILFMELLKPKPFRALMENGKEDLNFMKEEGMKKMIRSTLKIVAAPFIGLAYVIALPIGFVVSLVGVALNGMTGLFGESASFGWRPSEAYLGGKKKTGSQQNNAEAEEVETDK